MFLHVFNKITRSNFRALLIQSALIVKHNEIAVMSQSKSNHNTTKPKRVRWYLKLHLRSEPHEHVFFGEPTTHSTAPYLVSSNAKSKYIELDPFQDVDEESGWWFSLASSENLNYRLQSTSEQNNRRTNAPRNFPVKGKLSLSLYYELDSRSVYDELQEITKNSNSNSNSANDEEEEKDDEENSKESESEIIGNVEEIDKQMDEKKVTDTSENSAEEIKDTKDMFTAYQLPLEDYSITLDPDLAETASPPKSKKRPTRSCQVEFTRQKKGLCGAFHIDFQRSEGRTDFCVALFDNDTIVAVRLFVPMAYLPEEFKKEHEEELVKKQTRTIKFLEEDKLVEVHFINNKQPPAYHMSQDGIVDDKVQLVIEPERMTVLELREALKERNLPLEGVKKDLVKRLTAALNIGTCFKTEDESKSEETNGKKGSKKKGKASKKKSKAIEKLEAISEEQEEVQSEAESAASEVEMTDETNEQDAEIKEEKVETKTKPKGKKKAAKKKKGKGKKSAVKKQSDENGNRESSSQEDIMGSPIFPSAFDNDDKMTDVHPQSSPIEAAKTEPVEGTTTKKSKPKKGKSTKKSPAKKSAQNGDAANSTESSPGTESTSGASGSQSSSQGSNGEKSSAVEEKNSTPKRTPTKSRGKSPSKSKVVEDNGSVDKMEVEEKKEEEKESNIDKVTSSQSSDKNSSQEIASSSPKKKGQKRKREEIEASNNDNADHDSNRQNEDNASENPEPHTKRRRLSRSKEDLVPSTPPQSLTQSL